MNAVLPASIVDIIDDVRVSPDLHRATVRGQVIVGDTRRQLTARLATALYNGWHAGRAEVPGPTPKSLRDPVFEAALAAVVPHRTTRVRVRPLSPAASGATEQLVQLNRIRVLVPADRLVTDDEPWVRAPAVLPARSPGFLVVDGSAGNALPASACLRVYFHLDSPDAAPVVFGTVIERLEALDVPYRAKVISARRLFPRYDAIVVYLGPRAWSAAPDMWAKAIATGGLGDGTSAYVAPVDRGTGWAWDPDDPRPGRRGLSFGQHRSHAIAEGIVAAAGANPPGDRYAAVIAELHAAGISVAEPHRNVRSPRLDGFGG